MTAVLLAVLMAHPGPGHVSYTSFEAFPMPAGDIARALAAFPEVAEMAQPFLRQWETGETTLRFPNLTATIRLGDARETLPSWDGGPSTGISVTPGIGGIKKVLWPFSLTGIRLGRF